MGEIFHTITDNLFSPWSTMAGCLLAAVSAYFWYESLWWVDLNGIDFVLNSVDSGRIENLNIFFFFLISSLILIVCHPRFNLLNCYYYYYYWFDPPRDRIMNSTRPSDWRIIENSLQNNRFVDLYFQWRISEFIVASGWRILCQRGVWIFVHPGPRIGYANYCASVCSIWNMYLTFIKFQ